MTTTTETTTMKTHDYDEFQATIAGTNVAAIEYDDYAVKVVTEAWQMFTSDPTVVEFGALLVDVILGGLLFEAKHNHSEAVKELGFIVEILKCHLDDAGVPYIDNSGKLNNVTDTDATLVKAPVSKLLN